MSRLRDERGQVLAMTAAFVAVLLGVAALVVDGGSWFREDRRLQAAADAAALAGAHALPDDPAAAVRLALEYADKNGGGVASADVTVSNELEANDSVSVRARRAAPTFFSRLFGLTSVETRASAAARAERLGAARWVAPIAVNERHPLLQCSPVPCFDEPTEVALANLKEPGSANAAGAFGLVNLDRSGSGTASVSTLADWMRRGYDGLLEPGSYRSAPGSSFNSSPFDGALAGRVGDTVLLPVYRTVTGEGSNAVFEIVGWVGFTVSSFSGTGNEGTLRGSFTRVTWAGDGSGSQPDFGARTIVLVR